MSELADVLETGPALGTLEAVLEEGLDALPPEVLEELQRGEYSKALSEANDVYASGGPADTDAAVSYAVLLTGRDLVDEALGVLQRADREREGEIGVRLARAEALLVRGDDEGAEDVLDGIDPASVEKSSTSGFIGDLYLDIDCVDAAITWYERALQQGETEYEVAFRLAKLRSEKGDRAGAAEAMETAAELAGDDPLLWKPAAETFDDLGRLDDAIRCWKRYLELKPRDLDAWLSLGLAGWIEDRHQEAIDAFERVVDLDPGHRVALRKLGESLLASGRAERAGSVFRRLLEIDPDEVEVMKRAAVAARESGDVESAIQWAERAMQRAVDDAEIRYLYGSALLELGRSKRATEVLEPLVEHGDEPRGDYLGALAVAQLKRERVESAIEQIERLERLDGGDHWLVSFATQLLAVGGADKTREFLSRPTDAGPSWELARTLFGYLVDGLTEDDEGAKEAASAFAECAIRLGDELPLHWDFSSWEAVGYRLDGRFRRIFDAMIDVVEGRRPPEEFEAMGEVP